MAATEAVKGSDLSTIVGKGVCENFCFSGGSHTSASGPVRNPHNPDHMTGGSSSGCAALLVAGCDAHLTIRPGDELLTFVNRNLEPYRGYHIFMRALPRILRERPNVRVIIVGADHVSYGAAPADGRNWKSIFGRPT